MYYFDRGSPYLFLGCITAGPHCIYGGSHCIRWGVLHLPRASFLCWDVVHSPGVSLHLLGCITFTRGLIIFTDMHCIYRGAYFIYQGFVAFTLARIPLLGVFYIFLDVL